ncbi:MAG: hypothetical protein ABW123_04385 [Cystobacter sp.]
MNAATHAYVSGAARRGTASGPAYRLNWAIIHREAGRILLVSEGLSDPFIARLEPSVGFGLELVLETDGTALPADNIELERNWWPSTLLKRVLDEVVIHEHVREGAKEGLLVMDVAGDAMPTALVGKEGRVAVLLGLESRLLPRDFPTSFGDVRLVPVKVLLPSEREYLEKRGAQGPTELARRFVQTGEAHISSASRPAVV